jgi:hypothetical protein
MYNGSKMLPTGHSKQYAWLWQSTPTAPKTALPRLTRTRLTAIEQAEFLTATEKLELLGILLRFTFTGELSLEHQPQKITLLKQLNLPWHINSYRHSQKGLLRWLQISANVQIDNFIQKHSRTMSPIEAGLLYGYPTTAILAYANLINRRTLIKSKTTTDFWFSLVHSHDWFHRERQHYHHMMATIKSISPIIYRELHSAARRRSSSAS